MDIEDNAINGQFSAGANPASQKPERVVFVLLENQSCGVGSGDAQQRHAPDAAADSSGSQRAAPQPVDACGAAPKVNEPHFDSACYNGGSCRPYTGANYSCICPPGFAGPLCEINLDDCADHQCQNGAMCVDGVNSYKCVCRDPTTTGEFCEQLNQVSSWLAPQPPTSFSYATSSASSVVPLALPMIAGSTAPTGNELLQQQQQQILARSADFSRAAPEAQQQQSQQVKQEGGGCQRVTQRQYFDDGNGCQSVRVLKLSSCLGACTESSGGTCCVAARVKRRRIRMQCNDGASYVKTIDLVKKCACLSECTQQQGNMVLPRRVSFETSANKQQLDKLFSEKAANKKFHAQNFNATIQEAENESLQITRLDAVD